MGRMARDEGAGDTLSLVPERSSADEEALEDELPRTSSTSLLRSPSSGRSPRGRSIRCSTLPNPLRPSPPVLAWLPPHRLLTRAVRQPVDVRAASPTRPTHPWRTCVPAIAATRTPTLPNHPSLPTPSKIALPTR